jgi:predicted MPP superfamily phosphohydrolase
MVAFGLYQWVYNIVTRILYILATAWLGFLFIILFVVLGYDILRLFIKINANQAGIIIVGIVSIAFMFGLLNSAFIRTREIIIPIGNKLTKPTSDLSKSDLQVVQLSDLHIGPVHGRKYLEKVVKKTMKLKPDLVLITGDLFDGPGNFNDKFFSILKRIEAPIYFTTGNHESYVGFEDVLRLLQNTKAEILMNRKVDLGEIELIGINNSWNKADIVKVLKELKPSPDKFVLLMNHQPIGYREAENLGVDLMLSGHTHGGQFFPFVFMSTFIWRHNRGMYKEGNMFHYVTTGTGTWGPPIRLGTNSEVVLFRLVAEKS